MSGTLHNLGTVDVYYYISAHLVYFSLLFSLLSAESVSSYVYALRDVTTRRIPLTSLRLPVSAYWFPKDSERMVVK